MAPLPAPQSKPEHQQAFALYASLGGQRTYRKVAGQLGLSERTIRHWAKQGKWRERLSEREVQSARQLADRALTTTLDDLDQQRRIIHLAIVKLAKAIAEGRIKYQIGDLDRLVRLRAFLDGGPKGIDTSNKDEVLKFLKSVPRSILEEIAADKPPWPRPSAVVILPDNGTGEYFHPVVVLPDDGSDPDIEKSLSESESVVGACPQ